MATNLALQLQVIEPDTDLNSIMIGNSRYSDDIWDLRPFIISKSLDLSKTSLRFRYISDTDMNSWRVTTRFWCRTERWNLRQITGTCLSFHWKK